MKTPLCYIQRAEKQRQRRAVATSNTPVMDRDRKPTAEPIVRNDAESAKRQIHDVPREEIDEETRRYIMC